jgi:N-methylhydantoinase B
MSAIDPITLEVIRNALSATADEMALIIMRSSYSPVIRDTMDFSTALCDASGQAVAQGLTLAVQLGAFPDIMAIVTRDHAAGLVPGDVLIANDPYGSGGQHLPDIYVIQPIFCEDRLCGYATTMAHHSDVGGITPGSVAIHATEMHQEGLCLPMLKLFEAGRQNDTLFKIIARNTRQPVQVLGDLRAQIAACSAGARGLMALVEKYGRPPLQRYLDTLLAQAETAMRRAIAGIPDGRYEHADFIDGIGEEPQALRIQVAVTVRGEEIEIDFAGTAAQIPAAINCPIAMARSAAYCAIRCLIDEDIPNCDGYMRPIRITAPAGTIVNPVSPAACGARGVVGYRVFDTIMGAMSAVLPEKVIAGCEGGPSLFSVGGVHNGERFVLTEVMVGSWGARAACDGQEGISNPAANLSNQPVELIEAELPLEIVQYGLVPDSGGAGRQRGGLAFVREFRFLAEETEFTLRGDRRRHRPYGVAGGGQGGPSAHVFLPVGGTPRDLPTMPMQSFRAHAGDVFRLVSAGGGGFGDALERDPAQVTADVREGKVSQVAALRDYGVVLDGSGASAAATAAERARLRAEASDGR